MSASAPPVHQFTPKLSPGDATSNHVLQIRRLLRERGHESLIFVEHVDERLADEVVPYTAYGTRSHPAAADDVLLYHMAIGSTLADFVGDQPGRLVVDYHNITPERYFHGWLPDIVHGLAWGRRQLRVLADQAAFGMADSAYNAAELEAFGFRATGVVPILLDPADFQRAVDPACRERLLAAKADGGADVLFVGRLSPNKRQHEVIKAFAVYRRWFDRRARLTFVGPTSAPRYEEALAAFAAELGLAGAVTFAGAVPDGELVAHYQAADVFLCCSEHEGFCLPLLEAMANELPVVAVAAAAVPETLGRGGLCLERCDAALLAAAVDRVVRDAGLRAHLVDAGRERLSQLAIGPSSARFLDALDRALAA